MSVRSVFGITCVWWLNIYDSALSSCFPGARIDLSAEDNVISLALAECPARPYAELIKSDILGPSSSNSARSAALRPSLPSTMKVSSIGPSSANPTKGELLFQLGALSRKPRSVKRKASGSAEKDRPVSAKVPKLGTSSSSPCTHVRKLATPVRKPERAQSPPVEAPIVSSSQPRSRPAAKAKNLLGGVVEQPLAVMPITVWNPPSKSVRSPSRRAEELKGKDPEPKIGGDEDSLLLNAELAADAVSSILKDSDLERSKALPIDEALAISLQGVASVNSHVLSCYFHFELVSGFVLDVDSMLDVQVATHLKGLDKKAKLNVRHVKAARAYKARVTSLSSERSELQERVRRMTEEAERLKSDLKHTMSARA